MTKIDVNCLGKKEKQEQYIVGRQLSSIRRQLCENKKISNNILLDPGRKMLVGKKSKGWYESSGCEIQRRVEKGFECFGYKKVKLYVIAFIYGNSCLIRGNLCL